ncbi:DJ-1/PfpI family protein [Rhizobiales bacterium GAS191]|jgi:cyclohexyl-isocyanide hydratase|nr:DJ-1/PfpI family protein [Rhizobiales bacterium GAS113]SEB90411.1 DJ-1/PfpI family protein [Rhizobiales bacterium GAS191]
MTLDRRHLASLLAAGAFAGRDPAAFAQAIQGTATSEQRPKVGMLVYPDMILLDLAGPLTVMSLAMAEIVLVGRDRKPVATDIGIPIEPSASYETCPRDLDVIFVPGGLKGTIERMDDPATCAFLAEIGHRARFVTSVCTGSLLLGAAGLLKGYRATSHWYVRDLLPLFGASAESARVVEDRNRITGGGVTAGLDFGLTLAARLRDEETARRIQLVLEYDPKPPFAAGTPEKAGGELTRDIRSRRAPVLAAARDAAMRAKQRLEK